MRNPLSIGDSGFVLRPTPTASSRSQRTLLVPMCPRSPSASAPYRAEPGLVSPVVLAGSDTGALYARQIADSHSGHIHALILAGLPVDAAAVVPATAEAEIAARSACGTHQRVLGQAARTGLFSQPLASFVGVSRLISAPEAEPLRIPILAIHGAQDALSPLSEVRRRYAQLGAEELTVVADGRHDILNDASHRSVAATVVLFLERLRAGAEKPLVEVESAAFAAV